MLAPPVHPSPTQKKKEPQEIHGFSLSHSPGARVSFSPAATSPDLPRTPPKRKARDSPHPGSPRQELQLGLGDRLYSQLPRHPGSDPDTV